MFQQLGNLGFRRSGGQAFGFYITYAVLGIVLGACIGGAIGAEMGNTPNVQASVLRVVLPLNVLYVSGLGLVVLAQKKRLSDVGFVILAVLAGFISFFVGVFIGLIPVAYLTTRTVKGADPAVDQAFPMSGVAPVHSDFMSE